MSYFYPVCSNHLSTKPAVWFWATENSHSPVLILSSVPCFFPALSTLPALQKRTKESRSVPNTNKDHIFSTRLHPANCEPGGKVQSGGGLSARGHLTVGSQQPAWADKNIVLASNTMPTTKVAIDISSAVISFCFVSSYLLLLYSTDTLKADDQPPCSNVATETWWKHSLTKYTGLTTPWNAG